MKAQNIILAAAVFVGLYMLSNRNTMPPAFQQAPPPPVDPRQARTQAQIQALQNWIRTIVALYGNVRELWQPGGLFYSIPRDILDDINIRPPVPGDDPGGMYA